MKRRHVFAIALVCVACSTPTVNSRPSVRACLLDSSESVDDAEAYSAIFLLAHVALDEDAATHLVAAFRRAKDPLKKLALAYALDARLQFVEYRDAFVELYPTGRAQTAIWSMKTDYVGVTSPLQTHLAQLANNDDRALDKLVSGVPFADGSNAESLADKIQAISRHRPQAVKEALRRAGVSPARLGITIE